MTPDRRQFLLTASLAAAATTGLVACGAGGGPDLNKPKEPVTVPAADVPAGGGVILKGKGFVVTQPTAGQYKAFSSVCPHQGCDVTGIDGDEIVCGCHNSRFKLADGSVVKGPATSGLGPATVTKDGDTLTVTG